MKTLPRKNKDKQIESDIQDAKITQLSEEEKVSAEILLDRRRKAFGDYGIIILPSILVIDKEVKINLALSGIPLSFSDIVEDAILFSTGRITREQFESSGATTPETVAQQESAERVHRLASLARQLMRRKYTELALERYQEVIELDSTYLPARVGMARCFIRLNLLPEAFDQLQKVLKTNADHIEGNLMMARVEIMQGGEGIITGKDHIQRILTSHPDHPEANYLMGTVCEIQGEIDGALDHYKKAARLLLGMSNS